MLVFVDESGDLGTESKEGSSDNFIVTAVLFEDREEAAACDQRINVMRKELGPSPKFEFHFNRCNRQFREHFLCRVAPYNFFYWSIVINKKRLFDPALQRKDALHNYAVQLVFQKAKPRLNKATVVLDKSGSRNFRTRLAGYLKHQINKDAGNPLLKKVKMEYSHRNNLLQLTDMICGAVARSYRTNRKDAKLYRKIVSHRELEVQEWPKIIG